MLRHEWRCGGDGIELLKREEAGRESRKPRQVGRNVLLSTFLIGLNLVLLRLLE